MALSCERGERRTQTGQALGAGRTGSRRSPLTIRGGGHPKQGMVSTPLSRMGPPPRSFAADAHDCIMVRPPGDQPNTRVWRDDPRPIASSPLIVDGFRPTHLSSDVRTASDDGKRAQPSQHGDRSASAACDTPKAGVAGRKNSSGQVRNNGRGQVESHPGRNRLTSDAPYKALLNPMPVQDAAS